jgi:hypothetical protein
MHNAALGHTSLVNGSHQIQTAISQREHGSRHGAITEAIRTQSRGQRPGVGRNCRTTRHKSATRVIRQSDGQSPHIDVADCPILIGATFWSSVRSLLPPFESPLFSWRLRVTPDSAPVNHCPIASPGHRAKRAVRCSASLLSRASPGPEHCRHFIPCIRASLRRSTRWKSGNRIRQLLRIS